MTNQRTLQAVLIPKEFTWQVPELDAIYLKYGETVSYASLSETFWPSLRPESTAP